MCFTVAVVREKLINTTEKFLKNKQSGINQKKIEPFETEIPDFYMISGFSHPKLLVISDDGLTLKEWGLIPDWVKSKNDALELRDKTLNAKAETIFEKPSFKYNILSNRCLLPVSGFFEWHDFNNNKYPYYIQPSDEPGFLLASVFDRWIDRTTGEVHDTFSIVTTAANPLMEMIHNSKKRMPLILEPDAAYKWMDKSTTPGEINTLFLPFDENKMKAHTISKMASQPKLNRNFKEITNPVFYPELNQQSLF